MKKIYCEKCECWTDSSYEIKMFEIGELDNRCPICGNFDCLTLKEGNINIKE